MKYDSLSRNTVKITLSPDDMREYSLCAESIAPNNAETKRILSRMLKKMKLFPGFRHDRLFLEAFPGDDGGCVLYVSGLPEEQSGAAPVERAVMCCAENLTALSQLCRAVEASALRLQACVYRSYGGYILAAVCENSDYFAVRRIFSEFGRVSADPSEICAIAEYAVPVCLCDAVGVFSQLS